MGVGRDVPAEGDTSGECARLGAALPGVVGLRSSGAALDADVVGGEAVLQIAAVRVIGAILEAGNSCQ